jgi:cell division protein FtsI (penicillin-binding protein 3)
LGEEEETPGEPLRPIRYVRVSDVLDDATIVRLRETLRTHKITGVHLEQRGVREYPSGALAASIIGKIGADERGLLGAERTHEERLSGDAGRILYVRDAKGRPLWMGPDSFELPRRGDDLRLSIDLEIQRIGTDLLQRGVEECDAAGGRLVVMDPATGEILAMVDIVREVPEAAPFPWPDKAPRTPEQQRMRTLLYEPPAQIPRARYIVVKPDPRRELHPALARNRCVEDMYEPGSTFKVFTWATATELGVYRPSDVLQTHSGFWRTPYHRLIRDVHGKAQQTWEEVLINSSNIGLSQAAEKMTHDQLHNAVRRFGFGQRTGIGLPGESSGRVTSRKNWRNFTQTSVSFGQEIAVTPVQMARAFCAFARAGDMSGTLPRARLRAVDDDDPERYVAHRVLRPDVAAMVRRILTVNAQAMEAKMALRNRDERDWRYSMFGKSGTAQIPLGAPPPGKRRPGKMGYYERQYNSSFIAAGPTENPRLVVLVVIDDPGPALVRANRYYGSDTAGPVARRIMERSLAYLGVPPSPPRTASAGAAGANPD